MHNKKRSRLSIPIVVTHSSINIYKKIRKEKNKKIKKKSKKFEKYKSGENTKNI
jgi:hypothetical protein